MGKWATADRERKKRQILALIMYLDSKNQLSITRE